VPERYLGQTLGKYRIESLLGSGGFAWVFKGYDPELEIPVAIKVLKPQFAGDQTVVDRFKREASTAARLRHPNIIKIYAVGRESDAVFFVMDYLPSGLANRLETNATLPEDYVLRVGIDVARALGFAHREGVIHRDIKVDNILFDTHGNAVVADFGIARAVSGYTNQTGTNMVVGTPQYFAPEQARAKPLDGRADLYSLGVTLFRAATGRLPFEGEDWYEIARQHVEEPPPAPRTLNPALSTQFEAVVLQCMAKAPDDRPATGEVLADTITQILQVRRDPSTANTLTVPSTPDSTPRVATGSGVGGMVVPVSRRRLMTAGAIATVLVAGVAAIIAFPLGRTGTASPPDTLAADTTAQGDSTIVIGPGVTPTDSGTSKTPAPGKQDPPIAPSRFGSIVVNAPSDAQVTIGDVVVGMGNSRRDSLPPNQYPVRAVFPTDISGCDVAVQTRLVTVRAGVTHPITMNVRPCGTIQVNAVGRRSDNSNVPGTIWYSIQPEGGIEPEEQTLPMPGPKVLPVGKYILRIRMNSCAPYSDTVEILAGEAISRMSIALIC
jgi:serine/threonine-protein kinase